MARPEELGKQPNTVEAWTTTGDKLTAIRIQALGHFLYDLILKTEALEAFHTIKTGGLYDIDLDRPFADKLQDISESYPFNSSLMRHWLDLASKETAIPTLEQLQGQGFIGHIGLSYARSEDDPGIRSAQNVVEHGIDAPLRDHAEMYLAAESLGHPITSRKVVAKIGEAVTTDNAAFLDAIFQQIDLEDQFSEEDLTLRSFIPNWTAADERRAEDRRDDLEERRKRLEERKKWRKEGIRLQQGHNEVYQFLYSGSPRLDENPFNQFGLLCRAAHKLGYGVKVLERKSRNVKADEKPRFSEFEGKYLVMVDSRETEIQLEAIDSLLWHHKGWKFIDLIDDGDSLDMLKLLNGNDIRWFNYGNRFGEPIRDKELLSKGFIRAEMRRRERFYGIDEEYRKNTIANRYREVGQVFNHLVEELGREAISQEDLIEVAKEIIVEVAERDSALKPTTK